MSLEYISPEGLRLDGRRPGEIRNVECKLGVMSSRATGSAYLEMGNTKVLCSVFGPKESSQRSKALFDRAVITCECSTAPFATGERRKRFKGDKRSTELSNLIRNTFESVIITTLYPRAQIEIFVEVMQADGGVLPCAINAVTLACANAGIPMTDLLVACSAGFLESTPLCDLNHVESCARGPDLPVALLPKSGKLALVQMDGRVPMQQMDAVLKCAVAGCRQVYDILRNEIREHTLGLLETRGSMTT